jgi:pimeloyl-ACP methyl ester carboxylesterase
MDTLGHKQFAMVGFDTGMPIAYALAADHPDRRQRLVVGEAIMAGITASPPLLAPGPLNKRSAQLNCGRVSGDWKSGAGSYEGVSRPLARTIGFELCSNHVLGPKLVDALLTTEWPARIEPGRLAMSTHSISLNRYQLLIAAAMGIAAAGPVNLLPPASAATNDTIRTFRVHVPEKALADLRRRIAATRWPHKETVADQSQGVQLAKLQDLVRYWGSGYDWRKTEAKLNALPQFMTNIDGVDIHFIHVRSRHPNALPLIVTHGWPGSIIEQLKIIGPLTDPPAHGGKAEDAFDVVIPSIPGYGFSGKPAGTGWDPDRIARAWAELMKRVGYTKYVAQGGDWGTPISSAMARQAAAGLLGIHINLPATVPPEVAAALAGGPLPAGLSDNERAVVEAIMTNAKNGNSAYFTMMTARPQTVGYGATDSPVGLAAWILVHPGFKDWKFGADPVQSPTKDDVLDNITLYWLTNTATSAARLYWENGARGSVIVAAAQKTSEIALPVAITVFPEDVYRAPESWARRAYRNLIYFHEVDKGGHFAAWEQPELFSGELQAAFRSLR